MIDVIFTILVVFMITAPLMSQGVKVDLPKVKEAPSLDVEKAINVTVTKERWILIDETPSNQLGFRNDFRQLWTGDPEAVVILNCDQSVPYGFIMNLVTDAQMEGAVRFGFLTSPKLTPSQQRKLKRHNQE